MCSASIPYEFSEYLVIMVNQVAVFLCILLLLQGVDTSFFVSLRPVIATTDWLISLSMDLVSNFVRSVEPGQSSEYMEGQYVFVTGTTSGIGRELVLQLLSRCKELTIHCRPTKLAIQDELFGNSSGRGNEIEIESKSDSESCKIGVVGIDLSKVETIPRAIEDLKIRESSVDVLIHNAGLMSAQVSVRDIINVNCIAPFVLSMCMLPRLSSENSKIIYISSSSHIRGPKYVKNQLQASLEDVRISSATSLHAYAVAKYNSILLSLALRRRLAGTGLKITNIHPGN